VKRSSTELDELISKLEKELAEKEIYPLIEPDWIKEIEYFTHDEFSNKVIIDGEIKTGLKVQDINDNYNTNDFNPIDGKLIRAADHLAAFLEAYNSIKAGISTEELISACVKLKEQYKDRKFGKTSVKQIYSSFVL
jgi:putative hydrolase of HD superfamily